MKVFVINLDRRADRLARTQERMDAIGLAFTRVPAIDAEAAPAIAASLGWNTPSLTPGEVGCALSHRLCWSELVESGEEHCLIFEDDMLLSPHVPAFLRERSFENLDADIIRLETFRTRVVMARRPEVRWRRFGLHRLYSQHSGTGGYIIARAFARHLLETPYDRDMALDYFMFSPRSAAFARARILQAAPALCIQEKKYVRFKGVSDSDLGVRERVRPVKVRHRKGWDRERRERFASAFWPTERVWKRISFEQRQLYQALLRQNELE